MTLATIGTVVFTMFLIWLMYEAWRCPLYKENADGSWTQLTETKKLSDLFKRKNK